MSAPVINSIGPERGSTISTGLLLEYTHMHDGGGGMLPNGVGILFLPDNDFHPFVVWNVYTQDGKTWFAERGTYCMRLQEALTEYKSRGGKV